MPATDARRPGALESVLKTVPALPALRRLGELLPRRSAADEGGARRRPWILFSGMAAVLVLSGAGLAGVAVLRPATAPRPVPTAAAAPAPVDPLRRIRVVGDQLNLITRIVNGQLFIYAGGPAGVQTALSLARSGAPDGVVPHVVSLPRLSSAVADAFRGYGFEVTDVSVATDGPGVALSTKVPETLRPLHDALAERVTAALGAAPGLSPVHLEETVKVEEGPFLLATMVGRPVSRAFTAEGNKEVGDDVLNHFKLRSVGADRVELTHGTGKEEVRVVVPLHGQSRLASGKLEPIRPDAFAASVLN